MGKCFPALVRFKVNIVDAQPSVGTKHAEGVFHVPPSIHFIQMREHIGRIDEVEGISFKLIEPNFTELHQPNVADPLQTLCGASQHVRRDINTGPRAATRRNLQPDSRYAATKLKNVVLRADSRQLNQILYGLLRGTPYGSFAFRPASSCSG